MTPEERAALIEKTAPVLGLSDEQIRAINEMLYTLSEAGFITRIEPEEAMLLWRMIEIARTNKFTHEMIL